MFNSKQINKLAISFIYAIAIIVALILLFLVSNILINGIPEISWKFIASPSKTFEAGGGISVQLFNTIYLLILSMIISIPIALGAAIYLNEYAPKNDFISVLKTAIEVLSSLPSIVVGLFGFMFFVLKFNFGFSILSGSIALTFFNLPLLTRSIENSLAAIPNLQREAGAALGISRFETVIHVILPAALPSIITGIVLASGRVLGEAAALIFTAGQSSPNLDWLNLNPFSPHSPINPMRPAETLAVHIWKINSEATIPDATKISAGSSAVLLILVFIFNFLARYLGNKIYKKMTAGK
ncbi:MAG: phosphate ABC transporter permease PstA [Lactobacillaceae bacterium]|jgi:phosphate transport system permease protein|nr:phosphate ABC transporter permease PstA [Lactobacillaceae bacterium]